MTDYGRDIELSFAIESRPIYFTRNRAMPRVPYSYPPAGSNPIADAIRQRRGERGLTPLDGMLLNAAPIAEGWNKLLGGVRTGTSLPDDIREIMVSRCCD